MAEVVGITKTLTPNALLGQLLSRVDNIEGLCIGVKWKEPLPAGQYSAAFAEGVTMESGALLVRIVDLTYHHTFVGDPVEADSV